ncbi:hypothetical protein STTU_1962 [Streptomyces sp. Tu6071]|nr:hypothetical protein STTU_1962 [Streptomyces sp. Tu6071]
MQHVVHGEEREGEREAVPDGPTEPRPRTRRRDGRRASRTGAGDGFPRAGNSPTAGGAWLRRRRSPAGRPR